jgi:HD-GYP domain-containing protein (c-di-GMP phosphodiesterase class II)
MPNIRRAGWLHNLGQVAVSSSILNKLGPLSESEWERMRLHPYYTERILARSSFLQPLGTLASMHHERLDGSGYHRHLTSPTLTPMVRILAAADVYCAMMENRPHRPALTADSAADRLTRESKEGRFDPEVVNAVLSAAGHAVPSSRRKKSSIELTQREIEVLRLLARGLSNRQIASELFISAKTVGHHIQHIYGKLGVSTRAGATLLALQNNLLS